MAAPAFVQGGKATGSSSPLTIALTGVSVGDVIALAVFWANGGSFPITLVSDNQSNAWTTATTQSTISNEGGQMFVGVVAAAPGGALTITVSWGGGFPSGIVAFWEEISGINNTTPIQPSSGTNEATGTSQSPDSGSVTSATANSWAVGCAYITANVLSATGTLSEREQNGTPVRTMLSDALIATSGTVVDAQFSVSTSNANWIAQLMMLQPPGATTTNRAHGIDAYIPNSGNGIHGIDAYLLPMAEQDIQTLVTLIPPITNPLAFIKSAVNLAQPFLSSVSTAVTLQAQTLSSINTAVMLAKKLVGSYIKTAVTLGKGGSGFHSIDALLALQNLGYLRTAVTLIQPTEAIGCQGAYPDINFIKTAVWLVQKAPASQQAPGTALTTTDDWSSQTDALSAYQVIGRFILNGIPLIITGFTAGVTSWQTRTRQWLRLVDYEAGGVVISQTTLNRKLPNGQTINTVTQVEQIQDTTITTVTTTYSTNPDRVSKTITAVVKGGQTTTREIETNLINGTINTQESKIVTSMPPFKENVQPITVTTLDGVKHYQFFGGVNPNWAGGDAEGTTTSSKQVQVVPSTLNGETQDEFGNQIMARITNEMVTTPDGKVINTNTTEVGIRDAGTTTTDTATQFNGIQTTVVKTTNYPDGSQQVQTTVTTAQPGDSTVTTVDTSTDENGLQTVTTTLEETTTLQDPITGDLETNIAKTVTINGPNGTTVETSTTTRNNFEDDLLEAKIKVYLIQEFTINCTIDRFSKDALEETAVDHQRNFALAELIGQQLGNMDLSWPLRNNLIAQFNAAINCIAPVQLQALGKTYEVVFAPSASCFRAKYVNGTVPAVWELQMILQQRSDLVTGLKGF